MIRRTTIRCLVLATLLSCLAWTTSWAYPIHATPYSHYGRSVSAYVIEGAVELTWGSEDQVNRVVGEREFDRVGLKDVSRAVRRPPLRRGV